MKISEKFSNSIKKFEGVKECEKSFEYPEKEEHQTLVTIMVASSTARISQEVSKIQLVKSDACPPSKFCVILEIVVKGDSVGDVGVLIGKKYIRWI